MAQVQAVPVRQRARTGSGIGLLLERLVYFVSGVIVVLIAVRFVLEVFGANASTGFVHLVYRVSDVFVVPFNAVFHAQHVSGSYVDVSALVAILVYALVSWGLVALIRLASPDA